MHTRTFQIDFETTERYVAGSIQKALIRLTFFNDLVRDESDRVPIEWASPANLPEFSTELSTGAVSNRKTST